MLIYRFSAFRVENIEKSFQKQMPKIRTLFEISLQRIAKFFGYFSIILEPFITVFMTYLKKLVVDKHIPKYLEN